MPKLSIFNIRFRPSGNSNIVAVRQHDVRQSQIRRFRRKTNILGQVFLHDNYTGTGFLYDEYTGTDHFCMVNILGHGHMPLLYDK